MLAVYDVTRRETFEDLEGVWMREVELYSNVEGAICMVVANKVDLVSTTLSICYEGMNCGRNVVCRFAGRAQ